MVKTKGVLSSAVPVCTLRSNQPIAVFPRFYAKVPQAIYGNEV